MIDYAGSFRSHAREATAIYRDMRWTGLAEIVWCLARVMVLGDRDRCMNVDVWFAKKTLLKFLSYPVKMPFVM